MARSTLVVEDDPVLADLIATVLELAGHEVRRAGTLADARVALRASTPDLLLVDLGLPDGSGTELIPSAAAAGHGPAVIVITADEREDEHVRGLRLGADDVIAKPFRVANLMARVEAVLRRRSGGGTSPQIAIGDLVMDDEAVRVTRAGAAIELTATEFRLLSCLVRNRGRVVSKAQLLDDVWGYDFGGDGAVVERFVSSLRRKLGEPSLVHTVRGFGYTLREEHP